MDLSNPLMKMRMDELFGDDDWSRQTLHAHAWSRTRDKIIEYFKSRLSCRFALPFKIRYDPEDIHGGSRTKYYLLHVSNHVKAALLMKEIMWPLGDEEGTFDFSGESQGVLISSTPTIDQLKDDFTARLQGQRDRF